MLGFVRAASGDLVTIVARLLVFDGVTGTSASTITDSDGIVGIEVSMKLLLRETDCSMGSMDALADREGRSLVEILRDDDIVWSIRPEPSLAKIWFAGSILRGRREER